MADITATLQGTILEFDSSGFDATRTFSPTVTKVGDAYVMLYAGLPFFNNIEIGLSTSEDGLTWTKYSSLPVISNGSSQSWASFREVPATLLYEDGLYKLWFNGNNRNLSSDSGFGSGFGYATSPDGINWTWDSSNPIRWELMTMVTTVAPRTDRPAAGPMMTSRPVMKRAASPDRLPPVDVLAGMKMMTTIAAHRGAEQAMTTDEERSATPSMMAV